MPAIALAIVWFCLLVDTIQILFCTPILPLLPFDSRIIALLFSICPLTTLAVSPLVGAACDNRPRKTCLVVGLIVRLLAAALFMLASSNLSLPLLFTARACIGLASAATTIGGLSLLSDMVDERARSSHLAIAQGGIEVGVLIGAATGGFAFEAGGFFLTYSIGFALSCASGLALCFLREPTRILEPSTREASYSTVLRNPLVLLIGIACFVGFGSIGLGELVLPKFLNAKLGLTQSTIGAVYAIQPAAYFAYVLFAMCIAPLRSPTFTFVVSGLLMLAAGLSALPLLAQWLWLVCLAWLCAGFGLTLLNISYPPVCATLVANSNKLLRSGDRRAQALTFGRLMAVAHVGQGCGFVVGPIAGALLLDFGFAATFELTAALLAACALAVLVGFGCSDWSSASAAGYSAIDGDAYVTEDHAVDDSSL